MDHTIRVDQPSEQVIPRLVDHLERHALQVTTSFDLRVARGGHTNCRCPHHGQAECTCQYAILLIYDPEHMDKTYRTITVHGQDDTVWLTLLRPPSPPNGNTLAHEAVEAILLHVLLSTVTSPSQISAMEVVETANYVRKPHKCG